MFWRTLGMNFCDSGLILWWHPICMWIGDSQLLLSVNVCGLQWTGIPPRVYSPLMLSIPSITSWFILTRIKQLLNMNELINCWFTVWVSRLIVNHGFQSVGCLLNFAHGAIFCKPVTVFIYYTKNKNMTMDTHSCQGY